MLYALWSRDYVAALVRLLRETMQCSVDESKLIVRGLAEGKTLEIMCDTPGKAYDLSTDLLQLGVFTTVEQTQQVTDEAVARDTIQLMHEDLDEWSVYIDRAGKPQRMVHNPTMVFLVFERRGALELVARAALESGATVISESDVALISKAAAEARDERVDYAKRMSKIHGQNWKQILYEIRQGIRPPLPGQDLEEE